MASNLFRFKIRTILAVVALAAIPCAWSAQNYAAMKHEERLLNLLEVELGRTEVNNSQLYGGCGWAIACTATREPTNPFNKMASFFFPDVFERIVRIELSSAEYDDEFMESIERFPHLKYLDLNKTMISQSGILSFRDKRPDVKISGDAAR